MYWNRFIHHIKVARQAAARLELSRTERFCCATLPVFRPEMPVNAPFAAAICTLAVLDYWNRKSQ